MAKRVAKSELDKMIDKAVASTHTAAGLVQACAIACLRHAEEHGDPRKLYRLYDEMHKASRPEALKVWVEKYSPVYYKKLTETSGEFRIHKAESKGFKPFDLVAAAADPYWTPAETVPKKLTLEAMIKIIEAMGKRVENAIDKDAIAEGENVIVLKAFAQRMAAAAKSVSTEVIALAPETELRPLTEAEQKREALLNKPKVA